LAPALATPVGSYNLKLIVTGGGITQIIPMVISVTPPLSAKKAGN
jgi:hypothetical protein